MSIWKFLKNNARWLLAGFLLTFFSSFGQTFFISLSAGEIRAEYSLSHGEFGLLYMVATLASALTLPWLGKILDYLSPSRANLLILPMLAVGALGMAFSTHLIFLVVVIYLLRLFGQGMMTQNALTATGRWFVASRGKAMSVVTMGHRVGEMVFPAIFVAVAGLVGWRYSWVVAAIFMIVIALPLVTILLAKERAHGSAEEQAVLATMRHWTRPEVVRDPYFWLLLMGILAPPFIGTTIFFHQIYLVELRGWSMPVFASAFAVMPMTTIIFIMISGPLVDRYSAVRLLPVFLIPLGLCCFVLGLFEAQWSAFVFFALLGVSYGFSSTLFGAIWPELYGTKHLGAIRAVTVAFAVFGTAAGPGLTGWLIDKGVSYPGQIMAMGVYCFIIFVVIIFVSRALRSRTQSS